MPVNPFLVNSESRTFIREYTDSCSKYDFYTCTTADPITQDNGDVSINYYPDFKYNGRFVESSIIINPVARASTSIIGRIPRDYLSKVYQIFKKRVSSDIQLHFGRCSNPSTFNEFDEAIILEDVSITSYSTDKLGASGRDENAIINETVNVSIGNWYSIHKLSYNNVGLKIINDGYTPINMDILDCDDCSDMHCIWFVLSAHTMSPLANPFRIYLTDNNGRTWRYFEVPLDVYDPTLLHSQYTTISVFKDNIYLHIRNNISFSTTTIILSIPTQDLINGNGIWAIVATNGNNTCLPSSDKIVKFKHNYYAPYLHDLDLGSSTVSRIVNFGSTIGDTYTVSYVPKTNEEFGEGIYHDTPIYMVNYKDQLLFTGIFVGVPGFDTDPRDLYIAYTKNGFDWAEVPIVVDGVQATGIGTQYVHILPITHKHWLVTVQNDSGINKAYCTVNGGKSWKSVSPAFKGGGQLATYAPTESVFFSDTYRTYDGGASSVTLPDKDNAIDYDTTVGSSPSELGDSYARAYGCRNDPNFMVTHGRDGIHIFS